MSFPPFLLERAQTVVAAYREAGLTLATAESCTGGLIAALLTEVAGASAVFERGFVTYSNRAKSEILAVPACLIEEFGAVSEEVARAMAAGALASAADVALAVTGIAGPGGGSSLKPVGLVHLASARRGSDIRHRAQHFSGNREAIRLASVETALEMAIERIAG